MGLPKLKRYDKKFNFSYTYGTYPTLDLLKLKQEKVLEVIINPDGEENSIVEEIKHICEQENIPMIVSRSIIEKLAPKENTYVMGVFEKYQSSLDLGDNHLVLVNPSNLGNLGTILRSMSGFDMRNLALISPAADIFDPKVARSSMGSIFLVNFEYFASADEYISKYKENTVYSFFLDGEFDLRETKFQSPYSLVFGNEGSGLPESIKSGSQTVKISHSNKVDSLNLSVSVGITLYETSRQSL